MMGIHQLWVGGDCGRSILVVELHIPASSRYGLMYSICIFLAHLLW